MWQARFARALRAAPPLALAAGLFVTTLGASVPTAVAMAPSEPAARVEVVVKEVKIHDDREGIFSGAGEMDLSIAIWHCQDGVEPPCVSQRDPDNSGPGMLVSASARFSASSGDTVQLGRVVPRDGDEMASDTTRPGIGFPVFPGRADVMQFFMKERDDNAIPGGGDEDMGVVYHYLYPWDLGIGEHSVRSRVWYEGRSGDFTVTYEVLHAALPDLRPVNIIVSDLPGSPKKRVCMAVQNAGIRPVRSFEATLAIDGKVPADAMGKAGDLAASSATEVCVEAELPASGQHQLTANADLFDTVLEYNETNNSYAQTYTGTGPAATPKPTTAQPDLTVSTIKVGGRVAGGKYDGQDECKDGKYTVTVVVTNAGTADADDFAVRLDVDGSDDGAKQKQVSGLRAGQEREVTFSDIRLKLEKGQHTLSATADAEQEIDESNESNNERNVPAGCVDAD